MPSYSLDFKPPAPVIRAKLVKPVEELEVELDALIDTGASISVIPESVITELKLIPQTSVKIKIATESREEAKKRGSIDAYYLNIVIKEKLFELMKVIVTKQDHALIGRDILNEFNLFLEGKNNSLKYKFNQKPLVKN